MDFSHTAERISQKITSHGHSVEKSGIEAKLKRLVDEFGVPPAEAERTVLNELAREYHIPGFQGSGGGGATVPQPGTVPKSACPVTMPT